MVTNTERLDIDMNALITREIVLNDFYWGRLTFDRTDLEEDYRKIYEMALSGDRSLETVSDYYCLKQINSTMKLCLSVLKNEQLFKQQRHSRKIDSCSAVIDSIIEMHGPGYMPILMI